MGEEHNCLEQKKYKLVPPDGGWGYMIWMSVIILNVSTTATAACFGVIYNDFMEEVHMDTTSFALMNAINAVCFSMTAYAAGPLLKTMSQRQVAVLGTTLNLIGNIGLFWSYTQLTFFIFQSVMCAGGGFLLNISFTIINDYFLKKRLLSISFTQSITAFTGMLAPEAITWLLEEYGYREYLMMQTGLTMQCFVAAMLMQPVKQHLKKVAYTEDDLLEEAKLLLKNHKELLKAEDGEKGVVVKITLGADGDQNINVPEKHDTVENSQGKYDDTKKKKGILKTISDTLDLAIFKNISVLTLNLGLSLCSFSEMTFTMMLPQALYAMHWDNNLVAWSLTLTAFGDLATRIALTVLSKPLAKLSNKLLYMAGLVVAISTRLGMLGSESRTAINIYLTIMGISRCAMNTLVPLVLAEAVEPSLFAQALGMNMLIFGVGNIVLGPVIGAVRDLTNSYASSFYILTSFFAIVLLFWSIEFCYLRNQKKELSRKIYAKKSYKPK